MNNPKWLTMVKRNGFARNAALTAMDNPARLLGRMIRESFTPHLLHPDFDRQIEAWAAVGDEIVPAPDFTLTGKRDTFMCQAKGE